MMRRIRIWYPTMTHGCCKRYLSSSSSSLSSLLSPLSLSRRIWFGLSSSSSLSSQYKFQQQQQQHRLNVTTHILSSSSSSSSSLIEEQLRHYHSTITNQESITNPNHNHNNNIIITKENYDPITIINNIHKAAQWNQGNGPNGKWDPIFCSKSVNEYIDHLKYIQSYLQQQQQNNNNNEQDKTSIILPPNAHNLLSSTTTERALKTMLKMKIPTHELSKIIRSTEKLIGSIGYTPLTNTLSLRLLEANGKAGNIGRSIALLNLRKVRQFTSTNTKEFVYAIQSIHSAGLYLRKNRNIFVNDKNQPEIDNPTRWLDAILENMSSRNVALDVDIANRMLDCYACTGRSGKATHFFYKVTQKDVVSDDDDDDDNEEGDELDEDFDKENGHDNIVNQGSMENHNIDDIEGNNRKTIIRMKWKPKSPPFYKMPSDVRLQNEMVKRPRREGMISKLDWEKEKDWSPSLAAAFAFADSLTYGACGHQPIQLDLISWNTMIKVCCFRGAIFRALDILNNTMPRNNIKPDVISYNTILTALARVGDKDYMREMLTTMTNEGIKSNKYTVKALVDGYLNAGDVSGAVSLVQDMFNQHKVLPPYTTHLKIIEFALGSNLIYEAKREVYFIQQLWKWNPKPNDPQQFKSLMYATQRNPKLSKKSLKNLFSYFGEELRDEDFF